MKHTFAHPAAAAAAAAGAAATAAAVAAAFALVALPLPAQAHISLQQPTAPAGSSYTAQLLVGHGCQGSPTTAISVQVPEGLRGAKPQPKPGWTLQLRRAPGDTPGQAARGAVVEITWTAQSASDYLQDEWFDTFALRGTLSQQAGPLWFKVRQQCLVGSMTWGEVPADGRSTGELQTPAVLLQVLPADPHAGHQH